MPFTIASCVLSSVYLLECTEFYVNICGLCFLFIYSVFSVYICFLVIYVIICFIK